MHSWSLSIEEQFYVFYPLLLVWLLRRQPLWVMRALICGTFLSLVLFIVVAAENQNAAFYLSPARAWELLVGCLAALANSLPANPLLNWVGRPRAGLDTLVLASIVSALVLPWSFLPLPELQNIVVVLMVALLLFRGGTPDRNLSVPIYSILASRLLVWFGRISYSLYLWHWPLLLFIPYYLTRPLSVTETLLVLGLSIIVSTISERFIERPVRKGSSFFTRRKIYVSAFILILVTAGWGLQIYQQKGMPSRLPTDVLALISRDKLLHDYRHCHSRPIQDINAVDLCIVGPEGNKPSFILLGDSHADMMTPVFVEAAKLSRMTGMIATRGGCLATIEGRKKAPSNSCAHFNFKVRQYIKDTPSIDTLYLAGYWSNYFAQPHNAAEIDHWQSLEQFLSEFEDYNIYLIEDAPDILHNAPAIVARRLIRNWPPEREKTGITIEDYYSAQRSFMQAIAPELAAQRIQLINIHDLLCIDGYCPAFGPDNEPWYRNRDHLSVDGAKNLVPRFVKYLSSTN